MPSSLLTSTERVTGSTAAVLMHHSRTAFGSGEVVVGRRAGDRHDLVHHRRRRRSGRSCVVVRIEDGDPVDAVAADAGVVVVLGHQQVRSTCRRTTARPMAGTIDAVSSQPNAPGVFVGDSAASKCSSQPREWFGAAGLEHAEVDVAVGTDRRRRRAVVDQPGEWLAGGADRSARPGARGRERAASSAARSTGAEAATAGRASGRHVQRGRSAAHAGAQRPRHERDW